jgi:hypothetical protein
MSITAEEVKQAVLGAVFDAQQLSSYETVDGFIVQALPQGRRTTFFDGESLFRPPALANCPSSTAEVMIVRHIGIALLDDAGASAALLDNFTLRFRCGGHDQLECILSWVSHALYIPVVVQPHDNHEISVEYRPKGDPPSMVVAISVSGTWFLKKQEVAR